MDVHVDDVDGDLTLGTHILVSGLRSLCHDPLLTKYRSYLCSLKDSSVIHNFLTNFSQKFLSPCVVGYFQGLQ